MVDRPILFSAPMVRAILDGRKTQTRRVVKPRGRVSLFDVEADGSPMWTDSYIMDPGNAEWRMRDNPYGVPGDRLWVRETWGINHSDYFAPIPKQRPPLEDEYFVFLATEDDPEIVHEMPWRPSIHMPRWASRITLQITDVRVERLNEISEADALAEGAPCGGLDDDGRFYEVATGGTYRCGFGALWEHINGPGSWDANPWVWVVAFERAAP